MDAILPPAIQWRPDKANLGHNFIYCLLKFNRPVLDDLILRDPSTIESYVDIVALRELYSKLISGTLRQDPICIWNSVILGLWLRKTAVQP